MSRILAVFGATGQQGGSVVNYVLNDSELSKEYKIRAITRDINSDASKKLNSRAEVVQADVLDPTSLEAALTGVHTIFAMSTPEYGPDAVEAEYAKIKTLADTALKTGAEYIIFSTLPSPSKISGGKYTKITPFESKAKAELYIRSLPIKSAFFAGAFFMENFASPTQSFLAPRLSSDGTWVLSRPNSPKVQIPYIDAVGDTGKFVGAILAEPDKYEGKTFCAATGLYSFEEIAATLSKTTGKTVVYKQVSLEDFQKTLPPFVSDLFCEGAICVEEFGYFGPDSKDLIAWAVQNARGRLSTLEEYLTAHPLQLV